MDLSCSEYLTKVPDLSQSQKIEYIELYGCKSLTEIPSYFQKLDKLTHLGLGDTKLKYLPAMPDNLEALVLNGSAIEKLHSSIWSHKKICSLDIEQCRHLKNLPRSRCMLKVSSKFSLKGCSSLCKLPELPRNTRVLDLSGTAMHVLPTSSIWWCLFILVEIKLNNCRRLVKLPTIICKMESLVTLDLSGCSELERFPNILEPMEHLKFLDLSYTRIKNLHSSIGNLIGLKTLYLCRCSSLEFVPDSIYSLNSLQTLSFEGCLKLDMLPPFSVGLQSLEELDLSYSGIVEIPYLLPQVSSLRQLYLFGTGIESLPTFRPSVSVLFHLDRVFPC